LIADVRYVYVRVEKPDISALCKYAWGSQRMSCGKEKQKQKQKKQKIKNKKVPLVNTS